MGSGRAGLHTNITPTLLSALQGERGEKGERGEQVSCEGFRRWDDLEAVLAQPPVSFFSTGQRWPSWNPWTPRPPWPQGDHLALR